MRLNAPDDSGFQRKIRPGKTVTLNWYRRTDGAYGNVYPGAIQVVEQPPRAEPLLLAVHNPLATFYGADRESEPEAIERMFAPSSGIPVTPSDWENYLEWRLVCAVVVGSYVVGDMLSAI